MIMFVFFFKFYLNVFFYMWTGSLNSLYRYYVEYCPMSEVVIVLKRVYQMYLRQ